MYNVYPYFNMEVGEKSSKDACNLYKGWIQGGLAVHVELYVLLYFINFKLIYYRL